MQVHGSHTTGRSNGEAQAIENRTGRTACQLARAGHLGLIAERLPEVGADAEQRGEAMLAYLIDLARHEALDQIKRGNSMEDGQ